MATFGPYPGVVSRVIDGDTIVIALDLGFGIHQTGLSCRVYQINAPEMSTPEGKAARDYAVTLLPVGASVTVLSHGYDKYGGRYDGEIVMPDGRDFATLMIAAGHAVAYP